MYNVVKRDGKLVDFDISTISGAMVKAFDAQGRIYHPSVINMLALQVSADFEPKIKEGLISVERIQDRVERVRSDAEYARLTRELEDMETQYEAVLSTLPEKHRLTIERYLLLRENRNLRMAEYIIATTP